MINLSKIRTKKFKAFTLMELMVVIVIISVLAATALPLVSKYLRKSKTTEAGVNLRKIYDGEIAYYQEEIMLDTGLLASKQFVSAPKSPPNPGVDKNIGNWEHESWRALKFASDSPVQYSYSAVAAGLGINAAFTARAEGDLDGDGTTSLFERVGSVTSAGTVEGGAALFTLDELE